MWAANLHRNTFSFSFFACLVVGEVATASRFILATYLVHGVLSDPDSGPLQPAGYFNLDKLEVVVQCGRLNLKRDHQRLFELLHRVRPGTFYNL